jgi:hypothetical protein
LARNVYKKLAYGISKGDTGGHMPENIEKAPTSRNGSPSVEMAPLTSLINTHSNIVKDSLLIDSLSSPSMRNKDYYDDLSVGSFEERKISVRGRSSIVLA